MFVPKPIKIETKLNSNQSQIYPIDKIHWNNWRVPKAGRKKCATVLCIHKSRRLLLHCTYARPDRKPQEAPEGPRRAPESLRRPQKASGAPRRPRKTQNALGEIVTPTTLTPKAFFILTLNFCLMKRDKNKNQHRWIEPFYSDFACDNSTANIIP